MGEKDFTRSPKRQRRLGHGRRRRDRAGGGRRSGGSISKGLGEGGVDVRLEGSEERLVCARGESGILAQRGLQQPEEGARRLGDDGVVAPQELDDERVLGAMRRELSAAIDASRSASRIAGARPWRCRGAAPSPVVSPSVRCVVSGSGNSSWATLCRAGEPLGARGNRGGDPRGRPAGRGGALARVASSDRNFAQLALSSDDISVE